MLYNALLVCLKSHLFIEVWIITLNQTIYAETLPQPSSFFFAFQYCSDIITHVKICCVCVWLRSLTAAADTCLTCAARLLDVWRQLCHRLLHCCGGGGVHLVGLPKSNIFPIHRECLCVYSSPLLTLPSSELWCSADLKANNRPMLCLSLLLSLLHPPPTPVPPLPPFYLGQSLM